MTEPTVIVGGGLAGAAVACRLARAGQGVLVLEREARPAEKICGEFLSPEAVHTLTGLGIDVRALGGAPITRVRLVRGAAVVSAALPATGFGISRRVLDTAVLDVAERHGADIRRGHAVTNVVAGPKPALTVAGLGEISSETMFLATGKHDLRGLRRPLGGESAELVGLKLHLRLAPEQACRLTGHVEIVLLSDGYAGLQPIEAGKANLCMLIGRDRWRRVGGWQALLDGLCESEPHLRTRLAGAEPLDPRPLAIARVPFGFLHAQAADQPGVFRLGDQMAVIPSFTGSGMAIALHSAKLAAEAHLAGEPAALYAARMRRDVARQMAWAATLHRIGRSSVGQLILMRLAAAWPGMLGVANRLTRLSARAMA